MITSKVLKNFSMTAVLWTGALLLPSYGSAQSSLLNDNYPERYEVKEGDTLWDIAEVFLKDPARWQDIWEEDKFLDNSGEIFPGDSVSIAYVGGSPRLFLQRGGRETVKLTPQIRSTTLVSSIPAIPLESIENSFTKNRIIDPSEFDQAPYIVSSVNSNLSIGTGDEVYVRGEWQESPTSFEVYRQGTSYFDPETEELMGLEVEYLGFATIAATETENMRRVVINNSSREIKAGDRLLVRQESRLGDTLFPEEPSRLVKGNVISFLGNEALASLLDTVIINLGTDDDLEVGNILSINRLGETMVDTVAENQKTTRERFRSLFREETVDLPKQQLGTLLIYKTFDKLSYAVIISANEPIEIGYEVASP